MVDSSKLQQNFKISVFLNICMKYQEVGQIDKEIVQYNEFLKRSKGVSPLSYEHSEKK